jgi:hypothetical protein
VVGDGSEHTAVRVPERGEQLLDRRPAPEAARLEADVLDAEVAGEGRRR